MWFSHHIKALSALDSIALYSWSLIFTCLKNEVSVTSGRLPRKKSDVYSCHDTYLEMWSNLD